MNISFLYDNHAFASVGDSQTPRDVLHSKALELFEEDNCGMLFAKWPDSANIHRSGPVLHSRKLETGRYGVTEIELNAFLDAVEDEVNWVARG